MERPGHLVTLCSVTYPWPMGGVTSRDDKTRDGWTALSEASWEEARALFEDELKIGDSPEVFEGLSWAAWWLDDAHTVFEARERAYRLYKQGGDRAGAARMATWLAADHLDFHGAMAVASGWLRRAERLLESLDPSPEHGWLAFHDGYIASISGDTAKAEELGLRAAQAGRQFNVPDLEMLGLALQGAVLVGRAQVEIGMRCLDEATAMALAGEANVPISGAWACCFLVTACTAVHDYDRAFDWCDRIDEFAKRYGSRFMLAFCRAEYGAIHLWRGRWADAERLLEASVEDFRYSRPAWAEAPLASLAELRRRQGRPEDARRLLDLVGPSTAARLCRARLALDRGEALRAVELGERLLRHIPADDKVQRAPVLDLLVRAHLARGELDEAKAATSALEEIEKILATGPLRARRILANGMVAAAGGDHENARALLEDAVDGFERGGAPFEAAQARIELTTSLAALGRIEAAEREAVAARDRLVEMGACAEADRVSSLLDAFVGHRDQDGPSAITPREREVLALLAEGLTNRQIAEQMVVSEHTVHRHVTNILRKLDLPSRTAAASHAIRSGLTAGVDR